VDSSAEQLIIAFLESVACKVVCTACVVTKKINSKLMSLHNFYLKVCKFKFQQELRLI